MSDQVLQQGKISLGLCFPSFAFGVMFPTSPASNIAAMFNKTHGANLHNITEPSLALVSGVVVSIVAFPSHPSSLAEWDLLLMSGVFALIIGIRCAGRATDKLDHAMDRLIHRGALRGSSDQLARVRKDLSWRSESWSRRGAIVVAVSILAAFVVVMVRAHSISKLPLALFEASWAYVAGAHLARMAAYGRLGWTLEKQGVSVKVTPGHLDGAAGLKPVGDFFFFQSSVVAIPSIYLATWLLLIPIWPRNYSYWRDVYVPLLALGLGFELLAFFLPMWFFHTEMKKEKDRLLKNADELGGEVAALEAELAKPAHDDKRNELQERLSLMTKQYWNIEKLPTWPVDYRTRKHFTLGNAALFLPLVSELISTTNPVRRLLEIAGKIFAQS